MRARILFMAEQGMQNEDLAERLTLPVQIVTKWHKRSFEEGLADRAARPRPGGPPGMAGSPRGSPCPPRLPVEAHVAAQRCRSFLSHAPLERVNRAEPRPPVLVGPEGLGSFDGARCPATALHVSRRKDHGDGEFEDLEPGQPPSQFARNSFLVGIVEGAGCTAQRFATLADVIRGAPVPVVRCPYGLDRLPEVAERITDDARTLAVAS